MKCQQSGVSAALAVSLAVLAGRISDVSWLEGCWESTSGDRVVEEQWMKPRAGTMIGMGRTTAQGRLVEHEFVVLREDGDRLAYEAHPSGQAPATFFSTTITDSSVVFENLEHDFPQRVGYRLDGASRLLAWVEGTAEGRTRRIEFPYQRAACGQ